MDTNLFNYLSELEKKGHLDNTILYLFGDHGNHYSIPILDKLNSKA